MKKVMIMAVILGISVFLLGCASIINGTKQQMKIDSNPAGAIFKILDGDEVIFSGFTPTSVTLQRKKSYDVIIALKGYTEVKMRIDRKFSPVYLGNILLGGPIGLIVDAANGSMYKLAPNSIYVDFKNIKVADGRNKLCAVLVAKDNNGNIKSLGVPLVKAV